MGARNEWVGRRQAVRQTCQMRAEMRFLDGRKPAECTITDISATGARLTLPDGFDCPENFDLYIPSRDETKHAKVRRVTEDGVGIAFLKVRQEDSQAMQSIHERLARLEQAFNEVKNLPGPQESAVPDTSPVLEARLDTFASSLAELRAMVETRFAAPAPQPVDHTPDIATLRADLAALITRVDAASAVAAQPEHADVAQMIHDASSALTEDLTKDLAKDFAGIRAEMSRLDTSVRALTEMASVNAALTPADHGPEIVSLRGEVAALAQAVRDVTEGSAPMPSPAEDLSDIRAEMEKLGVSMRGQAHIPTPETLLRAQTEVAGTLPTEIADVKADIAELRGMIEKMSAATGVADAAPQHHNDTGDLRGEVENLRQSVRALIVVVAKSLNTPRAAA